MVNKSMFTAYVKMPLVIGLECLTSLPEIEAFQHAFTDLDFH